jgi:hypothetical protein
VIISDLTGFILSCLDEEERDARLFHEFTCAAHAQQARDGFPDSWCRCPVPAQTLARAQAIRDIIADCERQLSTPGNRSPSMLQADDEIRKVLGAIALSREQDPRWQEQWRP